MSVKYQYTSTNAIPLKREQDFIDFVNLHGVSKDVFEFVKYAGPGLELKFEKDKLTEIRDIDELNNYLKIIPKEAKGFNYFEQKINTIHYIIASSTNSNSYFGQDDVEDFQLPKSQLIKSPFQIIGKLSRKDKPFSWLPFEDFYICYPLFTGIPDYLFLDYSDPKQPKVFDDGLLIDYVFGEMPIDGIHQFEKFSLDFKAIETIEDKEELSFDDWNCGNTGVPYWIQHPAIPKCPVTGELMSFVCSIDTTESIKVKKSNLQSDLSYWANYSSDLRFWGYGRLFIFMHPDSKMVGLLIQDT